MWEKGCKCHLCFPRTFHVFEQGVLVLPRTFVQCWHYWQCWLPSKHWTQTLPASRMYVTAPFREQPLLPVPTLPCCWGSCPARGTCWSRGAPSATRFDPSVAQQRACGGTGAGDSAGPAGGGCAGDILELAGCYHLQPRQCWNSLATGTEGCALLSSSSAWRRQHLSQFQPVPSCYHGSL